MDFFAFFGGVVSAVGYVGEEAWWDCTMRPILGVGSNILGESVSGEGGLCSGLQENGSTTEVRGEVAGGQG